MCPPRVTIGELAVLPTRPRSYAKPRGAQMRVARNHCVSAGYAAKSRSDLRDDEPASSLSGLESDGVSKPLGGAQRTKRDLENAPHLLLQPRRDDCVVRSTRSGETIARYCGALQLVVFTAPQPQWPPR